MYIGLKTQIYWKNNCLDNKIYTGYTHCRVTERVDNSLRYTSYTRNPQNIIFLYNIKKKTAEILNSYNI